MGKLILAASLAVGLLAGAAYLIFSGDTGRAAGSGRTTEASGDLGGQNGRSRSPGVGQADGTGAQSHAEQELSASGNSQKKDGARSGSNADGMRDGSDPTRSGSSPDEVAAKHARQPRIGPDGTVIPEDAPPEGSADQLPDGAVDKAAPAGRPFNEPPKDDVRGPVQPNGRPAPPSSGSMPPVDQRQPNGQNVPTPQNNGTAPGTGPVVQVQRDTEKPNGNVPDTGSPNGSSTGNPNGSGTTNGGNTAGGTTTTGGTTSPPPSAAAVTLSLPAKTKLVKGEKINLTVTISSNEANRPSGVNFVIAYPSECLLFRDTDITLANYPNADKQPTAANIPGKENQVAVILFGLNNTQIPNGAQIVLSFVCWKDMGTSWTGSYGLQDAAASSPDAKDIEVTVSGGTASFKD